MKNIIIISGLIFCAILLAGAPAVNAAGKLPDPALKVLELTQTPTLYKTEIPNLYNASPTGTAIAVSKGMTFGWQGQIQCYNCAPFTAHARLHHYDPTSGPINCWDWDKVKGYCYSPTFSGIHWKSVWGFGAACPVEWKLGTWIEIPNVGAFICFDRGSSITCDQDVCNVDLLGSGVASWDGSLTDVTLWVPLDPPREDK